MPSDAASSAEASKSVFFCPECEYECRYGVGWTVFDTGAGSYYSCPMCDWQTAPASLPDTTV